MGKIDIDNQIEPVDTPPAGITYAYIDTADKLLTLKFDTGDLAKYITSSNFTLEQARVGGDTFAGDVDMGNNKLTNIATPENAGDAANKAFVESAVSAEDLWDRSGTDLSPKNAGDNIKLTTGNIQLGEATIVQDNTTHPPIYSSGQSGLDDLSASGTYALTGSAIFQVKIASIAPASDKFVWRKGTTGAWSSSITMTGSIQLLQDDINVIWETIIGHTMNDTWEIHVGDEVHLDTNLHVEKDLFITGDVTTQGSNRSLSASKFLDGIRFLNKETGDSEFHQYISGTDSAVTPLPSAFTGSLVLKTNVGNNPSKMNVTFWDAINSRPSFVLNQGGTGKASVFERSLIVGAQKGTKALDSSYTIGTVDYPKLDFNTSVTGADLGVENDAQILGNLYTDTIGESTTDAGVTIEGVLLKDGTIADSVNLVTANYITTTNDSVIFVDASSAPVVITLLASAAITGKKFVVKKVDSTANSVTIDGNASELIDGELTQILINEFESLTVQSDGSNWNIIADGKHREINMSTGWLWGGQITVNAGDNTKIDIAAGAAQIVDGTSSPKATIISWDNQTALIPTPLFDDYTNWVGVQNDGSGNAQFVFKLLFDPVDRRTTALLGKIRNNSGQGPTIDAIDTFPRPAWGIGAAFQDFALAFGSFSITGNDITAATEVGNELRLNKSAGESYRYNTQSILGRENHHLDAAQLPRMSYDYHVRGSSILVNTSEIDVDNYDNNGVVTALGNNKYSRQEIYMWPVSGAMHVFYSDQDFANMDAAVDAGRRPRAHATNIAMTNGAIHRASLITKQGIASISAAITAGTAMIIPSGGAGGGGSVAGILSLLEDTTPQLGGDLDILSRNIFSSTSNLIIDSTSVQSRKLIASSSSPIILLEETVAAVDEKKWRFEVYGGVFRLRTANDAETSFSPRLEIDRSTGEIRFLNGNVLLDNRIKIGGGTPGIGKVLTSDIVGLATWETTSIIGDLSPQLGGNLDVNGNKITSASNANIEITPDGTGNVCIGGPSPSGKLTLKAGSNNGVKLLTFDEGDNDSNFWFEANYAGTGSTGNWLTMRDWNNNNLMTWRGDGYVGFGTSDPDRMVHVKGANANFHLERESANGASFFFSNINGANTTHWKMEAVNNGAGAGSGSFNIADDGIDSGGVSTTRFTIDENGNIGMGTSDPDANLHINASNAQIHLDNGTQNAWLSRFANRLQIGAVDAIQFGVGASAETSDIKMTILNNGNVAIGPSTPVEKLDVDGNIVFSGVLLNIVVVDDTVVTGNVLIPSTTTDSRVKKSTAGAQRNILGVALTGATVGNTIRMVTGGEFQVIIDNTVTRGDYLKSAVATAGRADGSVTTSVGVFAIAMESGVAGNLIKARYVKSEVY